MVVGLNFGTKGLVIVDSCCFSLALVVLRFCVVGNSLIHAIMYYYYALSALKYEIWWKKYLTKLQLAQFAIFLSTGLVSMTLLAFRHYTGCTGSLAVSRFQRQERRSFEENI
jgi:hypothetical protein